MDWETESSSSEDNYAETELETKKTASNFSRSAICKWIYYIDNKTLDTSLYSNNTIDIIDDKIYDKGKTNDVVYKIGLDLVEASYVIPIELFKDEEPAKTVYSAIQKMVETLQLTYEYVVKLMNRKVPDLIFEPQTMTFYNHYNDTYRIGITVKKEPLNIYDKSHVYTIDGHKLG